MEGIAWLHYVQEWLAPSALAEIAGSIIGALVAVWVWRQDSRRRDRDALAAEMRQRAHHRLVLRLYLDRIRQAAGHFQMNCGVVRQNIAVRASGHLVAPGLARQGLIDAARAADMQIPRFLSALESYVSSLDHDETEVLFRIMDSVAEIEAAVFQTDVPPGVERPVEVDEDEVSALQEKSGALVAMTADLIDRLH